jgi:hypothetical protein
LPIAVFLQALYACGALIDTLHLPDKTLIFKELHLKLVFWNNFNRKKTARIKTLLSDWSL